MRSYCIGIILLFSLTQGCTTETRRSAIGFSEPANPETTDQSAWDLVNKGFSGGFGNLDIRYSRDQPPGGTLTKAWSGTGWRGERLHAQFLAWNSGKEEQISWQCSDLVNEMGQIIPASAIQTRPVRYVLSDEFLTGCGDREKDTIPVHLVGDILETADSLTIPGQKTRPLWLTINIPPNAGAGYYKGHFLIRISNDSIYNYDMEIHVQNHLLPPPGDWTFHLDLWQNPFAVARFHDLPLWSDEHWRALEKQLILLADAGQKCITTTIIETPWGGQTYDPFGSMIGWIRNSSGKWEFDYSIFDQYVQMALDCGIKKQINCYAMVPWGNKVQYFDEDSSGFVIVEVVPGTKAYEVLWRPFLYDFRAHLDEMGWLDITTLALDERGMQEMQELIRFLKATAPEFKITLAGHYFEDLNEHIYDFSYNWRHISEDTQARIRERREAGQCTTFYVACGNPRPNTFTFSPPAEATWIGWFAAAMGFDGFLRWAYNSWVENPLMDTRFRTWPAGDTYLVYPGPRSSIRFERLREGIQDYEKIRILMEPVHQNPELYQIPDSLDMTQYLATFTTEALDNQPASAMVQTGKKILTALSQLFESEK